MIGMIMRTGDDAGVDQFLGWNRRSKEAVGAWRKIRIDVYNCLAEFEYETVLSQPA